MNKIQLINMFKETIESTWQSMSESGLISVVVTKYFTHGKNEAISRVAPSTWTMISFARSRNGNVNHVCTCQFNSVSLFVSLSGGPKRPSAYNLYLRDHKELMRADNPDWTPSEVNKRVGLNWKHATNDVKNEYKKKALDMASSSLSTEAAAVASAVEEAITVS